MFKIAICEDVKEQQQILEGFISDVGIIETYELEKFDSGEDLVRAYEEGQRFSILLMDMKMNELDGIQTAERIRKYDNSCIMIIITSIIEYAVEGYSINAYDFILKPVEKAKFVKILNSAVKKKIRMKKNKTYVIQTRDKTTILRLSDIIYIESNRKKVNIYCKEGNYSNNENISYVENKLVEDGFVRISRYYLLNMEYINEIGVKTILLSSGNLLNYSEKYRDHIKKKYMKYMMEDM